MAEIQTQCGVEADTTRKALLFITEGQTMALERRGLILVGTVNLTQEEERELQGQDESTSCDSVKKQQPPRSRLFP